MSLTDEPDHPLPPLMNPPACTDAVLDKPSREGGAKEMPRHDSEAEKDRDREKMPLTLMDHRFSFQDLFGMLVSILWP
jgi:hypothetical protein